MHGDTKNKYRLLRYDGGGGGGASEAGGGGGGGAPPGGGEALEDAAPAAPYAPA